MSYFEPYVESIDALSNQCSLLHMESKPIPFNVLNEKYITKANAFLLDAYNNKKLVQYMIDARDPNLLTNCDTIKQFKLLIDIAEIWNNPKIIDLIAQLKAERQLELKLEKDIELKKEEDRVRLQQQINEYHNQAYNDRRDLHRTVNIHTPDVSTVSDDDISSQISEDDFMASDVSELFDKGYNEINKHSILQTMYNAERYNYCTVIDPEK